MRAGFNVHGDERGPEVVLPDAGDPQRPKGRKEMPSPNILRVLLRGSFQADKLFRLAIETADIAGNRGW